jgi:prolyl 3-hydroxylase /prolyl 3,4-dihydroxylase
VEKISVFVVRKLTMESQGETTMKGSGEKASEHLQSCNKRAKVSTTADSITDCEHVHVEQLLDDFHDVLSSEFQASLRASLQYCKDSYLHTIPYPYGCVPSIFQIDFMHRVIGEIKDHSIVNFKESDLFKVFQSIDLANLKSDDPTTSSNLPSVMKLRSLLYSTEFRNFIEDMNGLPRNTLSDKVDCACNCHMTGCHLLCHDDVIGTRKVSYILYLTENDPVWDSFEGGALELYDSFAEDMTTNSTDNASADQQTKHSRRRTPATVPCQFILPVCNTLAFFVVEPGCSFHAVQEVFGDRPRLSLQGWYHASTAPKNMEFATLQRLKSYQNPRVVREEDTEGPFSPITYPSVGALAVAVDSSDILPESDLLFLRRYIQEPYLTNDGILEIRAKFEQDSSVELRNFLLENWEQRLSKLTMVADSIYVEKQDSIVRRINPTSLVYYQWGVSDRWTTIGPAHKQRFLEYHATASTDVTPPNDHHVVAGDKAGKILYQDVRCQLLQSPVFGKYLSLLTSLGAPTAYRGRVRRFRPGRDYTVAHFGLLTQRSVLDATLCFVNVDPNHAEDFAELWQSGDCGGFECYIAADDEEDDPKSAADEYNADDDTELLSVSAGNNTLSLVYRDPGTMRFVKYVGSKAPGSRWDIAMEYEVPNVDDHDDGLDDDDGEGDENDCE